jgi:hypothetical protein
MSELNEKLLNCVLEHIEREVERGSTKYNQNDWGVVNWSLVAKAEAVGEDEACDIDQTMCGSGACFAGWACMLSMPVKEWRKTMHADAFSWHLEGQRRLGLTHEESNFLFAGTNLSNRQTQLNIVKERVEVIRECRKTGAALRYHPKFNGLSA